MAVKNSPMESLSTWRANATVCAPAFIKQPVNRQFYCADELTDDLVVLYARAAAFGLSEF